MIDDLHRTYAELQNGPCELTENSKRVAVPLKRHTPARVSHQRAKVEPIRRPLELCQLRNIQQATPEPLPNQNCTRYRIGQRSRDPLCQYDWASEGLYSSV